MNNLQRLELADRVTERIQRGIQYTMWHSLEKNPMSRWAIPLKKFADFVGRNPSAPVDEIVMRTGLTRYQVETLLELFDVQPKN